MPSRTARFAFPLLLAAVFQVSCSGPQESAGGGGIPGESEPFAICWHKDFPWSDWECPDSNANLTFMNLTDAESVAVIVKTKAGRYRVTHVQPTADGLFLTKRATDSILVRYYQSIGDQTKAAALRGRLERMP